MQPPLRGLWFRGPSPHVNSLTMRKASSAPGRALPLLFPPGDVSTSVTPGNPHCLTGSPGETMAWKRADLRLLTAFRPRLELLTDGPSARPCGPGRKDGPERKGGETGRQGVHSAQGAQGRKVERPTQGM